MRKREWMFPEYIINGGISSTAHCDDNIISSVRSTDFTLNPNVSTQR